MGDPVPVIQIISDSEDNEEEEEEDIEEEEAPVINPARLTRRQSLPVLPSQNFLERSKTKSRKAPSPSQSSRLLPQRDKEKNPSLLSPTAPNPYVPPFRKRRSNSYGGLPDIADLKPILKKTSSYETQLDTPPSHANLSTDAAAAAATFMAQCTLGENGRDSQGSSTESLFQRCPLPSGSEAFERIMSDMVPNKPQRARSASTIEQADISEALHNITPANRSLQASPKQKRVHWYVG